MIAWPLSLSSRLEAPCWIIVSSKVFANWLSCSIPCTSDTLDNGCGRTVKNSGYVTIYNITCDIFITSVDVEGGMWRPKSFLQHGTSRNLFCIMSADIHPKKGRKSWKSGEHLKVVLGVKTCVEVGASAMSCW
jgi:hypothetical protein